MLLRVLPHRSRPLRGLLAFILAGSLFACSSDERRGDTDLQIALDISPSPARVGPATVGVVVTDVDWTPRNGATVIISGTRDSLQLVLDTARGQGAGRYEAADFGFEVAGAWVLKVRVETTEGRWTEMDRPVTVTAKGS
jgi:hypothetical protein